jgi:hypothetical protein|tara:strand:- start:928 stop:2028 length:1101 start_codon:yes stop_codon:yes gene_type:complete
MEENNENVVEEIQPQESSTDDNVVKVDVSDNAPVIDEDGVIKVDLRQPPPSEQPQEEQVENVVEEITEEPVAEVTDTVEAPVAPEQPVELPTLPENIQKLVDFMEETGGDLNDYVQLNQNYDELDNLTALETYYKKTKPHLSDEEVQFMMDDQFAYNEEVDEERDIKRKKLAMKEQVAEAKSYLDSLKSKYYEDIKAGGKLTKEQQEAIEFFSKYNEELEANQKIIDAQVETFNNKTDNVFNDKFKGFEYNVGDKKFRFNVNNVDKVKETQSDINNFVKKFLNKENVMEDAAGYHKSLFTAMNPDAVAKHFYEQGRADALKDSIAKSKNIDMSPRQGHSSQEIGGVKVRALGDDSASFKFKIKNNK